MTWRTKHIKNDIHQLRIKLNKVLKFYSLFKLENKTKQGANWGEKINENKTNKYVERKEKKERIDMQS